jgi:BolA protein
MEELIHRKLTEAFSPTVLEITNLSHHHHGHDSSPQTGASHFHVKLQSHALEGLSRIEQHRRVYAVLQDAFAQGLHALSLEINCDPSSHCDLSDN